MSNFYSGKKILVTGGSGLIGIPLVTKLKKQGAKVRVVSLDAATPFPEDIEYIKGDLCEKDVCGEAVRGMDAVFHLAGIKGGIGVAKTKAATFLIKNILMNMLVMEAARSARVGRFLYASSICVYPPAKVFKEKNAGSGLPHPSDKFGGMAKLVGELQIEAYKLQYHTESFLIARPTNTYGPYDNFNPGSALIIPALIYRAFNGENPLTIWGDGSAVRDFVYADDAADFLLLMMSKNAQGPYNVGSGKPVTIKKIALSVARSVSSVTQKKIKLCFDPSKPTGEKYRVASIKKAKEELHWQPKVDLEKGILKTVQWYNTQKDNQLERYSILSEDVAR